MSQPNATKQAIGWLEQQLTDLNGIRNATPRDPSFKNWRQGTLTIMQRIWPNDQDRQERFRRIPFSPADPRADARTIREWYSRGCQEAGRVLSSFIADIQVQGVPQQASDSATRPTSAEFTVDFPTVDLPSSDARPFAPMPEEADDMLQLGPSPSGSSPKVPLAPSLQQPTAPPPVQAPAVFATFRPGPQPPAAAVPPPAPQAPLHAQAPPAPVAQAPHRQSQAPPPPKKGVGARLRDLLGFAQLSAKAFTGAPTAREEAPPASAPARFEVQPVGDEVMPPRAAAPAPARPVVAQAPPTFAQAPPTASAPPTPPTDEMREPGMSVVMSRPTTLRGSIEKVSIESLISPEFRSPAADDPAAAASAAPATPDADPLDVPHLSPLAGSENITSPAPVESPVVSETPSVLDPVAHTIAEAIAASPTLETFAPPPAVPEAIVPSSHPSVEPVIRPAAETVVPVAPVESVAPPTVITTTTPSGVYPLPTPSGSMPAPSGRIVAPPPADAYAGPTSTIIPLPPLPKQPVEATGEKPSRPKREAPSKVLPFTKRPGSEPLAERPEVEEVAEAMNAASDGTPVDPEEFAQATEDFMRTSPVLGATGRKVKREGYDDHAREASYNDPDAIAIATMLDDLDGLSVPKARHKEARARLEDLARRLENGDLEWAALRKAVWFAMEYPELARRLMPLLLPWIDRAA